MKPKTGERYMAEITPFRGLRYDREKAGDIGLVVAPPYDIIPPALQDDLYNRSHHNVVRLDFAKTMPGDDEKDNRYARAKRCLDQWLAEGVLVEEDAPALYLYKVDYKTPQGEPKAMSGFICMLKLYGWDEGVVLPHEGTLKGPKADRFELMKATAVSASQIFSLYSDPERAVTKALDGAVSDARADISVTDDDGAVHRIWAVKDEAAIETVRRAMSDKKIFIADGHHRYETALAYRDYCREKGVDAGYVPMFLSNMDEGGLTVLPTHRLVKDAGAVTLDAILKKAEPFFHVEAFTFTRADEAGVRKRFLSELVGRGQDGHAFGFYFDRGSSYYLLTLKDMSIIKEAIGCERSDAYCSLDVTILHTLVVERVLGIDTGAISDSQPVQFEKDGEKAIARVAVGEFAMCFLLNATKVSEVKEVALAREIMPQKSTYFYPKLLTGLVIAKIS